MEVIPGVLGGYTVGISLFLLLVVLQGTDSFFLPAHCRICDSVPPRPARFAYVFVRLRGASLQLRQHLGFVFPWDGYQAEPAGFRTPISIF